MLCNGLFINFQVCGSLCYGKEGRSKASGGKQPSLPDFSDQEAVQRFFLQEVQLGEELLATGDIQNGVEHLSLAVAVCGQPHSLLSVLQQTLPPQVNIDPGIIKNIFNLGR